MKTSKLQVSIPGQDLGSDSQGNSSTTLRLGKSTTLQKEVEFKMYLFPQDLLLIVLQPEFALIHPILIQNITQGVQYLTYNYGKCNPQYRSYCKIV